MVLVRHGIDCLFNNTSVQSLLYKKYVVSTNSYVPSISQVVFVAGCLIEFRSVTQMYDYYYYCCWSQM